MDPLVTALSTSWNVPAGTVSIKVLEVPIASSERYTTKLSTRPWSYVGVMVHDRVPLRVVGAGSTWSNAMDMSGWAGTLGDESYKGTDETSLSSWRPVVSFTRTIK